MLYLGIYKFVIQICINPNFLFFFKLIRIDHSNGYQDKCEVCYGFLIKNFIEINDSILPYSKRLNFIINLFLLNPNCTKLKYFNFFKNMNYPKFSKINLILFYVKINHIWVLIKLKIEKRKNEFFFLIKAKKFNFFSHQDKFF